MTIAATYISASQFSIGGEHDQEYEVGRRIRLAMAGSGSADVTTTLATYSATTNKTVLTVTPASVQSSLVSITRGASSANSGGHHGHTGHGDGGPMPASAFSTAEAATTQQLVALSPSIDLLTAGEALTQRQVVYMDQLDSGKCKLASNDLTEAEVDAVGMVYDATIAEDAAGQVLFDGIVTYSGWSWTPGARLFVGATPGEMTEERPAVFPVRCARAITAQKIRFHNPFFDLLEGTA